MHKFLLLFGLIMASMIGAKAQSYVDFVEKSYEYLDKEDLPAAAESLRAAMRLEPGNPNNYALLMNLGTIQRRLGEMDEAVWNETIRAIRQRAGFSAASALDFPGGGKEEIMKHIRYERRIEFAGEGTYYNDLRRWRIAENEMANLNIYRYDGVQIGTRNFNKDRDYWWPVPASQIEVNPTLRPNNPGW